MKYNIHILSLVLSIATMAGCSQKESPDAPDGQEVGSKNSKPVPEGYFVATFSSPTTRAEADFIGITGEDPRVFDLRYLIYAADGDFIKEQLIFDDFDADTDDTQDWPLPSITDTLPLGNYKAVFIANTDPDLFRREANDMPLPDDLLTDYKLGFDHARLNLPYLLGADDPDFFIDVIEFSDTDSDETVYLQRVVGVFKAYRSLVDVQEALDNLVADLVSDLDKDDLFGDAVRGLLEDQFGGVLGGVLQLVSGLTFGALHLDDLLDPLVNALVDPIVDVLYDNLLKVVVNEVGSILETNNGGIPVLDLLGKLLNPWSYAEGAAVTVSDQPTQFGFDMEVKARDPASHKYYLPITTVETDGEEKRVVITKYLGFEDIDNDGVGEELMTLEKINVATWGVVGGLLDNAVDNQYLLEGVFFDIEDPLDFHASGNLQIYNEYSLVDLGIDDSVPKENRNLTVGLSALDIANLGDVLSGTLDKTLNGLTLDIPIIGDISLNGLLGLVGSSLDPLTDDLLTALIGSGVDVDGEGGLTNLEIEVPISLPLLNLTNLEPSGGWDPYNTPDDTPDIPVNPPVKPE